MDSFFVTTINVRSKKSGAAADSVFHPTWKWYTLLHFLKMGGGIKRIYRHWVWMNCRTQSAVINHVNIRKTRAS